MAKHRYKVRFVLHDVQIPVVLGRSLTQPHQAVRTRTTRSKGRVSPPRSTYEDGGNSSLLHPIISVLFMFFFPR
jgi:hypothetical protein